MDTPAEEQQKFMDVSCNIAATVSEITKPNSLSIDLLEEVLLQPLEISYFLSFLRILSPMDCLMFQRLKPSCVDWRS